MNIKTASELRQIIAAKCEQNGLATVANELDVAEVYISQILSKHRDVSKKVAIRLGYQIVQQPKPEKIFAAIS